MVRAIVECIIEDLDLVAACAQGYVDLVQMMITNGIKDDSEKAMVAALTAGYLEIVLLLMVEFPNQYHPDDLFRPVCRGGNVELVEFLIDCGADVWEEGFIGGCEGGQLEVIKLMIGKGISKPFLEAGIMIAHRLGHCKVVEYIRQNFN